MGYFTKVLCVKFLSILLLVSLFSYCGYEKLGCPEVGVDDANIFMVYAKHLSEGHGFVYNRGGEKVEGFSSVLFVLILSLFYKISSSPERLIVAFNILCITFSLTFVVVYLDELRHPDSRRSKQGGSFFSLASLVFLGWTFSCPAYICWTTVTLMDTGLWSSLLLLSSVVICRSLSPARGVYKTAWYVIIPLLVLARPEALMWVPVLLCAESMLLFLNSGSVRSSARALIVPFLLFVVSVAALTLFRLSYFGFPLPNTFYAKVSPDMFYNILLGLGYAQSFISSSIFIPLTVLSAGGFLVIVMWRSAKDNGRYARSHSYWIVASLMSLMALCIPVLIGGDHFRWFRFYQPLWPLMIVPLYAISVLLLENFQLDTRIRIPPALYYVLLGFVCVCFSYGATPSWHDNSSANITHEGRVASRGRHVGEVLNDFFHAYQLPTVGVISAGGIKYTYRGDVVDLMGLNHVAIAHFPGDRQGIRNHAAFSKEVFYGLAPHIVLPRVIDMVPLNLPYNKKWHDVVLKGLLDDQVFNARYTCASVRKSSASESVHLCGYFRNDYLQWLKTTHVYRVALLNG